MLYAFGYRSSGPKGRFIGALMLDVALVAFMYYTFTSLFAAGGGLAGIENLFRGTAAEYGVNF